MSVRLENKRIVVTGAASGLGRAIALRFAREKWRVAVADVQVERAEETLADVRAAGGDGFVERCDVRDDADWDRLRERTRSEWGGTDVIVNNAGVGAAGTLVATPVDDWQWMLDINLMGVVRGCRAF